MRNLSKLERAAMGALVAAALVAGAEQASAAPYRFPADTPRYLLPFGRAKIADARSGGIMAGLRMALSSVWRFPGRGSL